MYYKKQKTSYELLLAIDFMPRGFAFAMFEKPDSLIDWGLTDIRINVSKRSFQRIRQLIEFYRPSRIVLEDVKKSSAHRSNNLKQLSEEIKLLARNKEIQVTSYSAKTIQEVFSKFKCQNKHERAKAICEWLPQLSSRIPPKRAIWMSEDPRINLFDAVSLALTHYYLEN